MTPARSPPTWRNTPPGTAARSPVQPARQPGRVWTGLKNYVANTAVTWPRRLRQIHSSFRNRSLGQMLGTAVPWTRPWLPAGYEQNFGMLLSFRFT
jgi:hypothetical protein